MRLFAVRMKKDRQAVGIFWADTLGDLWWMVDHVCDPGHCEYHPINERAALVAAKADSPPLGVEQKLDDGGNLLGPNLIHSLTPEFALYDYFYEQVDKGWKPLPYFGEPGGGFDLLKKEMAASKS